MSKNARFTSAIISCGKLHFRTGANPAPTQINLESRCKTEARIQPLEVPLQADVSTVERQTSIEAPEPSFTEHDIFRCIGVDTAALRMRRRVQLGIFLEICGTQVGNILFHNNWNQFLHDSANFYFENSAVLLAFHVWLMWWYHKFLRDALLARHVTRIAVCRPSAVGGDSKHLVAARSATESETWAVVVETGPWTRRLELSFHRNTSDSQNAVSAQGQQVSLGQVLRLGVLHVDWSRGHVLDTASLTRLVDEDFLVTSEEITTDVARLESAYIHVDRMVPFLEEAGARDSSGSSFLERLGRNAWLNRAFQLPGGPTMDGFGLVALVMGLGSVVLLTKW